MKTPALLLLAAVILSGCATTKKPLVYYYGGYEQAYYHSKKDNTPDSVAKYKLALEDVIRTSERKGLRVPPGIYCEYGYLLSKQGSADAERYFNLEVATYPESAHFVAFLKTQIKQN
jgi:hypothetical protein